MNQNNIIARASNMDDEKREATFIASTSAKDRHNTVVNQSGWLIENFNKNPIIGYQHEVHGGLLGADPDDVIGTGRAYIEDGKLMVDVKFEPAEINEKADKIWQKVKAGTLRSVSVGFIGRGGGILQNDETMERTELESSPMFIPDGFTFFFSRQELLEVSIVNVPSNPEALKVRMMEQKQKEVDTDTTSTDDTIEEKQTVEPPTNWKERLEIINEFFEKQ